MMQITKFLFILFSFLLNSHSLHAITYTEQEFKQDLLSPYKNESSKLVLAVGGGMTLGMILLRPNFVDQIQEDMAESKPLGSSAVIGDYSGQWIPNIGYAAYQFFFEGDSGYSRASLMARASLFAGGTTFFLKRLYNEKRPSGGDRLSFPSGHATTAFAFAGVIWREHPKYKWYAMALATLVGASRMNDDAHYLHDVTMGATIGLAYSLALPKYGSKNNKISFIPYQDGAILNYSFKW